MSPFPKPAANPAQRIAAGSEEKARPAYEKALRPFHRLRAFSELSCVDEKDTSRDGAPHGGAARLRRTSIFAAGKNLGGGGIHFRRAFQAPEGGGGLRPPEPTKKDIQRMSFFVVTRRGFEPRTHCLKGSCSAC